MELELESGAVPGPIDIPAIERALGLLGSGDGYPSFAILTRNAADQDHYVQAHVDEGGFVVEKREGHAQAHFTAMRSTAPDVPPSPRKRWQFGKRAPEHERFALAEIIEIFRGYVDGSEPTFWKWVPLELSE
ncbi:MAG TPA: hypothetical protein VF605_17590 [Allosphingosinicella sp.]|jgi:hypothetical protein